MESATSSDNESYFSSNISFEDIADSLTVRVFAFGAGGSRFNPQPGHTKDIKNGN